MRSQASPLAVLGSELLLTSASSGHLSHDFLPKHTGGTEEPQIGLEALALRSEPGTELAAVVEH